MGSYGWLPLCRNKNIGFITGQGLHSVENPLLHLHSVFGSSKVYGCDCDLIAELAKREFNLVAASDLLFLGASEQWESLLV
jgi:pimeloyl-ACP methyl ester carboxylesterase